MTKGLAIAFLSAVLSACSGAAVPSPTVGPTGVPVGPASAAPSVTPPSAQPSIDLAVIAAQYKAAADKANAAIGQLVLPSAPTLEQVKSAFGSLVKVADDMESSILAIEFPPSMADDVKGLIRASQSAKSVYRAIASATSMAEVSAQLAGFTKARGDLDAAIDIVRHDLGLPRAGG